MTMLKDLIQWEIKSGTPRQINAWTITPQSRVLVIRFPFGGFVWNWPISVVAEQNGRITQHTITDTTRSALLVLTGISFVLILATITSQLVKRSKP